MAYEPWLQAAPRAQKQEEEPPHCCALPAAQAETSRDEQRRAETGRAVSVNLGLALNCAGEAQAAQRPMTQFPRL